MSQNKGEVISITGLMLLLTMPLLVGCQSVKLNGVDEMLAHPQFPQAARCAPVFTKAVLKKLADTEAMVEQQ
jgi:hypothetical protein